MECFFKENQLSQSSKRQVIVESIIHVDSVTVLNKVQYFNWSNFEITNEPGDLNIWDIPIENRDIVHHLKYTRNNANL